MNKIWSVNLLRQVVNRHGWDYWWKKLRIKFNLPVILYFASNCFIAILLNCLTNSKSNKVMSVTYYSSLISQFTYLRVLTHVFEHKW